VRDANSVLVGKPEGKSHLEELGADRSILLKWILKKRDGGMVYIDLAQDREGW
jgi:hypothetical protein